MGVCLIPGVIRAFIKIAWALKSSITLVYMFPQTVCLTLGVLTVIVKGRVPRSRCRTDFVAIFVVSCLHVRFSSLFTYFRACRARRDWLLNVNFRSFRLFNFFDVRFPW